MEGLMFWGVSFVVLAIGLGIYVLHTRVVDEAADLMLRLSERDILIGRLVNAVDGEPTRPDANDPLRDRYVFCGRHPEQGHATTCAWMQAVTMAAATAGGDDGRDG